MSTRPLRISVATLLVFSCLFSIASGEERPPAVKSVVPGNTAFALDLYSKLKQEKGNLFFSPYSVSSALALMFEGARGDTSAEMAKTLRFSAGEGEVAPAFGLLNKTFEEIQKKGEVQLNVANSLWPQKGHPFLTRYLKSAKKYFGVSVSPLDYQHKSGEASRTINAWIEDKTKGKIRDVIRQGDLDAATRLVLVNAIYFKGKWASQFNPKLTTKADFSLLDGGKTPVSMMNQTGKFRYAEIEGSQALELPYVGKDLSMVIILPSDVGNFGDFEKRVTGSNLDAWISQLHQAEVSVALPKFKGTWGVKDLVKPLQELGMRTPFSARADFSGMDGTRTLFISLLRHKAFLDINEEGTEAAAATVGAITMSALPIVKTFRADHPFLFVIRENTTGSILILGRIVEPNG
ncbi:serpin family protein [Geomonas sp.]|uniref:serpin family protein n=1 Tax=Geomonas sp. TaxID=2651584 RepID=UPI002B4602DF|nr:serpin family protein [Geomonas sp.]HJV33843.1 serpin family protein [Geomonas sp.]